VSPSLGGFEGFDWTNPRGQFCGERFHLAYPKLDLRDAIISHTILVLYLLSAWGLYTSHRHRKRRRAHHWGFPARRTHHLLKEGSLQEFEGSLGDLSTWVLLAGPWPWILMPLERFLWYILFPRALGRIEEKEDILEIHIYSVWRGYTLDMTLRLHIVTCSVLIYISRNFQGIWRPPSSGPKYRVWQF